MHRIEENRSARIRIRVLGVAAALIAAAAATSSSCMFDLQFSFCAQSGLQCPEGQECAARQAVCIEVGGCGNGVVDAELGEVCDDGNVVAGSETDIGFILDGCSPDCMSTQVCGNSIRDTSEECDYGDRNGASNEDCDIACRLVVRICGNGVIEAEECDLGPMDSATCNGDSAGLAACRTAVCGDGYTNTKFKPPGSAEFESCDNAGGGNTSLCNGNNNGNNGPGSCRLSSCGDHYTNSMAGEECDSGAFNTAACNGSNATVVAVRCRATRCGDGYRNTSAEDCDTPNGADTNICNGQNAGAVSCRNTSCGDGYANTAAGEQCDPGGSDSTTCNGSNAGSQKCRLAICGDGYLNAAAGEDCETNVSCSGAAICNNCKCVI